MSTQDGSKKVSRWQRFRSKLPARWVMLSGLVLGTALLSLLAMSLSDNGLWHYSWLALSVFQGLLTVAAWDALSNWELKRQKRVVFYKEKLLPKIWLMMTTAVVFVAAAVQLTVLLDRSNLVRIRLLHPDYKVLNPVICVNRTPTLGFAGPYPEVLEVAAPTISSVGVCRNMPQLPYGLNVRAIRINGVEKPGDEFIFETPLEFLPGSEVGVVLVGEETEHYRQLNSPYYVIRRTWGGYGSILSSLQMPNPGFGALDWERMEKVGLVFDDHGRVFPDGTTDAIYARYYDDVDSKESPVLVNLRSCTLRSGDLVGYMYADWSRERHRFYLLVPPSGGLILVQAWESKQTLMTCNVR